MLIVRLLNGAFRVRLRFVPSSREKMNGSARRWFTRATARPVDDESGQGFGAPARLFRAGLRNRRCAAAWSNNFAHTGPWVTARVCLLCFHHLTAEPVNWLMRRTRSCGFPVFRVRESF